MKYVCQTYNQSELKKRIIRDEQFNDLLRSEVLVVDNIEIVKCQDAHVEGPTYHSNSHDRVIDSPPFGGIWCIYHEPMANAVRYGSHRHDNGDCRRQTQCFAILVLSVAGHMTYGYTASKKKAQR